jgi:hypothetical protein
MINANNLVVAAHIAEPPRPNLVLIRVVTCREADFVERRENTALVGILLSILHHSASEGGANNKVLMSGPARYSAGLSGQSRTRIANNFNKTYDRIATYADINDQTGRCFCVILKTSQHSSSFFESTLKSQEGVGNLFLLEEPDPVSNSLGTTGSVPVVDDCTRALPLVLSYTDSVPAVPITAPDIGETRYFCQHGIIDISMSMASIATASCSGIFCDRQSIPASQFQRCGCFHHGRSPGLVIQLDVTLPVPADFEQRRRTTITRFRSWRTSQLFIKPDAWAGIRKDSMAQISLLRQAVRNVVDHVNANGGWTYIGWLRTGAVHDSSDTSGGSTADNLANTTQRPHLSYLLPTNADAVSDANAAFQAGRLDLLPPNENDDHPNPPAP